MIVSQNRPDDSTSDDSTPLVQSTVTTQISQAHLYNQTEANMANCINELTANNVANSNAKPITTVPLITASNVSSLRRLHSMPTQCESDIVPIPIMRSVVGKPPVPERNADLIMKVGGKRIPPPPPPRTSSRSPLASPTSPNVPQIMPTVNENETKDAALAATVSALPASTAAVDSGGETSSGNESGNDNMQRQVALEMRHQELLKKQKVLQEQYQRLQQMSKMPSVDMATATGPGSLPVTSNMVALQKMGSESNIQQKISLTLTAASDNGSGGSTTAPGNGPSSLVMNEKMMLLNRANSTNGATGPNNTSNSTSNSTVTTTKQVYETEIL